MTVIDKFNDQSEDNVCGNQVTVTLKPPEYSDIVQFMFASVAILLALSFLMYLCLHFLGVCLDRKAGRKTQLLPPLFSLVGRILWAKFSILYDWIASQRKKPMKIALELDTKLSKLSGLEPEDKKSLLDDMDLEN